MLEALGRRLRQERVRLLAKQVEFSEWGGVKANSQINYESGKTAPTVEYLYKLADHGVDIGYVLTGRRADGTPDAMQTLFFEMFGKLSDRERGAIFNLVAELAGHTRTLADLNAQRYQGSVYDFSRPKQEDV